MEKVSRLRRSRISGCWHHARNFLASGCEEPNIRLVYIDDSGDDATACYTALIIDAEQWTAASAHLALMRRRMHEACGIYPAKELHAGEFLGGRGKYSAHRIDRARRVAIFRACLQWFTRIPSIQIINAVMDLKDKERCFDWLLNRIETNMRKTGETCIVISDEGKEYNALLDRKRRRSDIPSAFGDWGGGELTANIPITKIVERIFYRDSRSCAFIQAADFCAYALFRKERPLAAHAGLGVDTLFAELNPVTVKAANRRDPDGIVRRYKT